MPLFGGGSFDPNKFYALSMIGAAGGDPTHETHLNCGQFWVGGTNLTNSMYWRMWIKKNDNSGGYVISDSYGGGHALLLNVDGAGNIYFSPGGPISFGSDDTMPVGQWFELAIALTTDNAGTPKIVVYMNGIIVGVTEVTAANTRHAPNGGEGSPSSILYIGGSSHINANFQIAQLQAFDLANPWLGGLSNRVPQRFYNQYPAYSTPIEPDLYMDMTKPSLIVPDLSWGYAGGVAPTLTNRKKHNGVLENTNNGIAEAPMSLPLGQWVLANDGPWVLDSENNLRAPGGRNLTPRATPIGAKIFDSFQREDQNFAFSNKPTLGNTESGSLGVKAWQQGILGGQVSNFPGFSWGIFGGNAVYLDANDGVAWVVNDSADMDVSVSSRAASYGNGMTGLAFRVQDSNNYWVAFHYWNSAQGGILILSKFVAGVYSNTSATGFIFGRGDHTIRVTAIGTNITVFMDGVSELTTSSAVLQTAKGAGIAAPVISSSNSDFGNARWSNFLVK